LAKKITGKTLKVMGYWILEQSCNEWMKFIRLINITKHVPICAIQTAKTLKWIYVDGPAGTMDFGRQICKIGQKEPKGILILTSTMVFCHHFFLQHFFLFLLSFFWQWLKFVGTFFWCVYLFLLGLKLYCTGIL
jgi:hypothetical protein